MLTLRLGCCFSLCRDTCRKLDQVKVVGSTKVVELWTRCVVGSWASRRDLVNILSAFDLGARRLPARTSRADNCCSRADCANVWRVSRRDVPRIQNRAFIKAFETAVDLYLKGTWDTAMEKLYECEQVCAPMSFSGLFPGSPRKRALARVSLLGLPTRPHLESPISRRDSP